jgi:putative colanic acid biosynthesis UDP-glucose lipid carrier transferase
MQNRFLYIFSLTMAVFDFAVVNAAIYTAFKIASPIAGNNNYIDFALIISLFWFLASKLVDLYEAKTIQRKLFIVTTVKTICLHLIFFLLYNSLKGFFLTGQFTLAFYTSLCLLLLSSRYFAVLLTPILKKMFNLARPIALLGVNPTSMVLADFFEKNEKLYNFAGFLNQNGILPDASTNYSDALLKEQIRIAANTGINEIYVCLAPDRLSEITGLINEARKQCIRLKFVPDYSQIISKPLNIQHLSDLQVITLTGSGAQEQMDDRVIKRVFDIVFSLLVIVFIFSWLYPILAILIKLESPGPVIFKQGRSGQNNVNFWCYKFRSMRVNQDSNVKQASRDDARITKMGRFLRRTSLDELPQFFNVFLGNMSIVGPRPHMLKHTEHYRDIVDKYMARHYMKPGITGWAQVNGYRGETQELHLMEKRVEHDLWYLENWSASLDIKILFMTIGQVFKGHENAY